MIRDNAYAFAMNLRLCAKAWILIFTYLLLEFVLEFNELIEKLCMNILYTPNALIMNLSLQVFLWDLLA